jgi:[ribosomal protein S18]-alanine N-acetyltransferase
MRAMTLADVDAVLVIELAVQAYPWTRGNFNDALSQGYLCRVEEECGEICGYAVLMPLLDEAELLNIGVAAGRQRKGLGRAMLREMLDVAREWGRQAKPPIEGCSQKNIRRVFLEVRASNAAALALYRSTGFGEIGVRRGYYQNANGCEDAITMACELKQDSSLPHAEERPGERANG